MITKKSIELELNGLSGLKEIARAYEEIAAIKIRKVRDGVLQTRDFLAEINKIYQEVKVSYKKEVERLLKAKKIKDPNKFTFLTRNGKTLYVFVAANTGLYGGLIRNTFNLFYSEVVKTKADVAIIGKVGLSLYQEKASAASIKYFDFPDQTVDDMKLEGIIKFLIEYEKIVVFYGEFKSLISQNPVAEDVSGNTTAEDEENIDRVKYLFEPTLEKVLEFFEMQIFSSIFEQAIRESQLAKFAARMVSLDAAYENINKRLNTLTYEERRIKHREVNRKQNQTFSSIGLWR